MNRGEVYWLNFDPQIGAETKKIRPAVILSRQPFNTKRKTVIVVPLSKAHTKTEWPLLIAVQTTGTGLRSSTNSKRLTNPASVDTWGG